MKGKKKILIVAILIIAVILGGTFILWMIFFKQEDMEIDSIFWTKRIYHKEGYENGKKIYSHEDTIYEYTDEKTEKISNISLDYISKSGEDLLVGVQNLHLNADGFRGIITYNISSGEINEILACDEIYDYVGGQNYNFGGSIQMTKDGKFLYFVCGYKMLSYDVENDKLAILFETFSAHYSLNKQETCLYISDSPTLYRYDLVTETVDILLNGHIYGFAVSEDEKVIVYEEFMEKALYLYNMDTGEKEKLVDVDYGYGVVHISKDNRYILYTDYKEAFVPTNRKIRIYVLDLETGKRKVIHRGTYSDNIRNVLW